MEVVLWIFMPLLNVHFISGTFSNDAGYFLSFSVSTYFPIYVVDLFGTEPCNRLCVSIYQYRISARSLNAIPMPDWLEVDATGSPVKRTANVAALSEGNTTWYKTGIVLSVL